MAADSGRIASFRDPAGKLFQHEGRILRLVHREPAKILEGFLGSPVGQHWRTSGRLVGTTQLKDPPGIETETPDDVWFEHERVAFPSYPFEWPSEMLHAAGRLTLEFAQALLPEGWGLKDGTPYNVLFCGPKPVFVDLLSIERRDADDPTWLPYAQFVRTFLLPLAVNRDFGMSLGHLLAGRRDGLEPEEVAGWLGPWNRLRPPYLTLVTIPARLGRSKRGRSGEIYRKQRTEQPQKARFIVGTLLNSLSRQLARLEPGEGRGTQWSDYMATHRYAREEFEAKERFVDQALRELSPRRVLDAGCNTGHFSEMAARVGAEVVAIDLDEAVAGNVWRRARAGGLPILPLVVNLTRPTPAMGWRNRETLSFLERARGGFDLVLMLALIHHMLVSERIPLEEILDLAADLTAQSALIEFVDPADEMFQILTRGREKLHRDLTPAVFERACSKRFEIVRSLPVREGLRKLYLLKKR